MKSRVLVMIVVVLSVSACGMFSKRGQPGVTDSGDIAFVGARVIDGSGAPAQADRTVLVRDGVIAAVGGAELPVPDDIRVIDLDGRTLMPGLISAHSHLAATMNTAEGTATADSIRDDVIDQLRQYQRFGVTGLSVLGAAGDLVNALIAEQAAGTVGGAVLLPGSDRGIGVQDGAPPMNVSDNQVHRPATPDQARAVVRESAARGSAMVKLWVDDMRQIGRDLPKMRPEIFEAVIDEAHGLGLKVAAHIYYLDDAKALLRAGADIIAHGVRDQAVDAEFIELMTARDAWYVATLTVDESFFVFADQPALLDDPLLARAVSDQQIAQWRDPQWRSQIRNNLSYRLWRHGVSTNQDNLRELVEANVNVAFGTDSGANPARIPGYIEHRELLLSVGAGLEPVQAIALATGNAAAALGLADRGRIEPGQRADLIVLAGDPAADIATLRTIEQVWQDGRQVAGELLAGD